MSTNSEDSKDELITSDLGDLGAARQSEGRRSRRFVVRRTVDVVAYTGLVVATGFAGAERQVDQALNEENEHLREENKHLLQLEVERRLQRAANFADAFALLDGPTHPSSNGVDVNTDSRRQQIEAIANGIANDPALSADPLMAFRYARATLNAWGRQSQGLAYENPDSVDSTPLDIDQATAAGLASSSTIQPSNRGTGHDLDILAYVSGFFDGAAMDLRTSSGTDNVLRWKITTAGRLLDVRCNLAANGPDMRVSGIDGIVDSPILLRGKVYPNQDELSYAAGIATGYLSDIS